MRVFSIRRLFPPFNRRNTSEIESSSEDGRQDTPIILEPDVSEVLISQAPQFTILERIRELEEFLESQDGVGKAKVSFITGKDETRSLQILITSKSHQIRTKRKRKLVERLASGLEPRIDMSREQIFFKVQKAPKETSIS